jgi:DHA2 family methylenomycin A resistance protein-like MFS transporter
MPRQNTVPLHEYGRQDRVAPLPVVATSLGFFLVQLDVTIVNVALDRIAAGLSAGVAGLQWVVNAYTVAFASLLLGAGTLGDRWGARRGFVCGLIVFTAASSACAAAPGLAVLVAARAAQGVGAAFLMACSLSLLTHAHPDDAARARAVGIWTAIGGAAVAAGPVLGGTLVDSVGWRSIFVINLPVGALALWLTLWHLGKPPRHRAHPLDVPGQLLAVAALGLATATLIETGALGWRHPVVLGGAVAALAAIVLFVAVEARAAEPMLPLRLLRTGDVAPAAIVGFLVSLAFYGLIFVLSLFFQRAKGYSPLLTGLAFLPLTAAVTLANIAGGHATARLGPVVPMVAGQLLSAAGYLSLIGLDVTTPYGVLWWRLLALPLGIGFAVPALTAALLASVERDRSGLASGILTALRQAGAACGVALYGAFVGALGAERAMLPVAVISAAAAGGGALLAFVLMNRARSGRGRPQPSAPS